MKVSRFLSAASLITCLCLVYVYQQTEIFRLAYAGQKKQTFLQDLLDKNSILRYNIQKDASLVNISDKIAGSSDFQIPDTYRLVRLAPYKTGAKLKEMVSGRQTLFSRLFGVKRQAEAKTLNP